MTKLMPQRPTAEYLEDAATYTVTAVSSLS